MGVPNLICSASGSWLRPEFYIKCGRTKTGYCQLAPFPHVHIVDSTDIRLADQLRSVFRGTRSASSLKVQLAYEYKQGHIEAIEIVQGCDPDQTSEVGEEVAESGDLMLFDLGYFDQKRLARLDTKDVMFVSRLHSQAGLYPTRHSQQAIKLLEEVRGKGHRGELTYYLGSQERLAVRVLYYHLPEEVVAERRRKAHQTCPQARHHVFSAYLRQPGMALFYYQRSRRPVNDRPSGGGLSPALAD